MSLILIKCKKDVVTLPNKQLCFKSGEIYKAKKKQNEIIAKNNEGEHHIVAYTKHEFPERDKWFMEHFEIIQ